MHLKGGLWDDQVNMGIAFDQMKSFAMLANKMQTEIPIAVGIITASAVHFQLFVSFFMVSNVVEQGQCIRENNMVLTAVIQVQPWLTNNSFN